MAPDAGMLYRLALSGYDSWLASEMLKAQISRSDHPFPNSNRARIRQQAQTQLPSLPALDTPYLPQVPGQTPATPLPTDAFGFPSVP
jgi:hypothetical protein